MPTARAGLGWGRRRGFARQSEARSRV